MFRRFAMLVFGSLMFAPLAMGQGFGYPPQIEGARVATYKEIDGVTLKLWIFEPKGRERDKALPAIVFFFGGGWQSGSPEQFERQSRHLASRGMIAIVADYRVASRHRVTADRCVADAKSAIRWVRSNAKGLGIDPDRIVAAGGSAGGHLAACTATIVGLDEPTEDAKVSSVPSALALFNPAVVLAPYQGLMEDGKSGANLGKRLGVSPRELSPIHHIRAGLPPAIIFHGKKDATVPYATVEAFEKAYAAAGNRCELVGYPEAGHGFFNFRKGSEGDHHDTLMKLDRFLVSLGYLPDPLK